MAKTTAIKLFDRMTSVEKIPRENGFSFELFSWDTVNYKYLASLKDFFGTDEISVESSISGSGCCEMCYSEEVVTDILVMNPTKNIPDFRSEKEKVESIKC